MITRAVGENFKVVVSTKKTLLGASASSFEVHYANVDTLEDTTIVAGGATEAIEAITAGSEHTATLTAVAQVGTKVLVINSSTSTLVEGDAIEYTTGLIGYIQKIVGGKLYLRTAIKTTLSVGTTLTQVGNLGKYLTPDISISTVGEYLVSVEAGDLGIFVEQRVKVVDTEVSGIDGDAPDETIAVAH